MLAKLLKYEVKATARTLIPIYICLVVFTIINKLFFMMESKSDFIEEVFSIPAAMIVFAYSITMVATFIVTIVIVVQRFYKNLLSDEGYLMNTLPVDTHSNILAKLIVATGWFFIAFIVSSISIGITFAGDDFFYGFLQAINLKNLNLEMFFLFIQGILGGIFYITSKITLVYAAISIGHSFNEHKKLISFATFMGLSIINNVFTVIIGVFNNIFFEVNYYSGFNHAYSISKIVFYIILTIAYFIITNYVLKNKLNLE